MKLTAAAGIAASLVALLWVWQLEALDTSRQLVASAALLTYAALLWIYYGKLRRRSDAVLTGAVDYLIAFATETGTARALAHKTRKHLLRMGATVNITELNKLAASPVAAKGLVVVASTSGSGDAPRTGDQWLADSATLAPWHGTHCAVLALGDRSYSQFCGFGIAVAAQLQQAGLIALFEPVLVSQADPQSLDFWFRQLKHHLPRK